jgi:Sortase family.
MITDINIVSSAGQAVITQKTLSWLTLVTCKGYNETSNAYNYRVTVQAVLVQVK